MSVRQINADIAQSVVRRIGSAEVTGSIPVISFFYVKISLYFKGNLDFFLYFTMITLF